MNIHHLMHYRTTTGMEVDFVLENRRKELIGIEVKAAATIASKDFNGLRHLRDITPDQFVRGILLYTGEQTVQFDKQLVALPIASFFKTPPTLRTEQLNSLYRGINSDGGNRC